MPGHLDTVQQASHRRRLERPRPEPAQLAGRPGKGDRHAPVVLQEDGRRRAGEAEDGRAHRNGRLLAHAGDEVGIRPTDALGDAAGDGLDLEGELLVYDQLAAGDAGDRLHRAVVVRRPETAGEDRDVGPHGLANGLLELPRVVADDEHPRGREPEPRQLAREEGSVGVGLVSPHELAAREDDDRSRHR